ncbi:MAG: Na+/H+ antiporter subunit E [Planctomycetota bacterium]
MFLLNLVLAVMFGLMLGGFSPATLISGFVIGFLILNPISKASTGRAYGGRIIRLIRFGVYFVRILVIANIDVAREVITPGSRLHPRIVRFEVTDLTPVQITVLSNAITLTPGTLVVDVSDKGDDGQQFLYIHCMFGADRGLSIEGITELRRRLLTEVFG